MELVVAVVIAVQELHGVEVDGGGEVNDPRRDGERIGQHVVQIVVRRLHHQRVGLRVFRCPNTIPRTQAIVIPWQRQATPRYSVLSTTAATSRVAYASDGMACRRTPGRKCARQALGLHHTDS